MEKDINNEINMNDMEEKLENIAPYSSDDSFDEIELPEEKETSFEKFVVSIKRVSKVLKGGKKLSFSALVVVGNKNGLVGYSLGKANEVPMAIEKASKKAMKSLINVPLENFTLPFEVFAKHGSTQILLKPARTGTGVIAGLTVRSIMDALGVRNVLTKIIGSTNPTNVVKATFKALKMIKKREEILALRQQ